MGVFAEIRNGFECFCKYNIFFCFQYLSKEKLCSILVFGSVRLSKVVRLNHDNVVSRGAVGHTHTIVRLQTRIRQKMERRISGVSYMCWMDFHNEILCCGFTCARLISVSFSGSLPQRGLPRPTALFPGYHAEGYHARTDAIKLTGYHVSRVTTHPSYHAPNKLLGTGRLSHLRVVFSYFSFYRLMRQ